jgi:hypothetical protein
VSFYPVALPAQNTGYLNASGDATGAADYTAITALLTAGTPVTLLPGQYYVSQPIVLATGAKLAGIHGGRLASTGSIISPGSAFAGAGLISIAGAECQIRDLTFLSTSATPVPCLKSTGNSGVKLEDLLIYGTGFSQGIAGASSGDTAWLARDVSVHDSGASAFAISNIQDSTWLDCYSLGAGGSGFVMNNCPNTALLGCRAEWSAAQGFYITGGWNDSTGSGGLLLSGCSTDRNADNGVYIDATGNVPVVISGMTCRRDGSGSTSSGLAGVNLASTATVPVTVGNLSAYPGVNDDGSGNDSPEYGISVQGAQTYLAVENAYLHAVTAGTNGLTTGNNASWRNVATRTGPTSGPGSVTLVADSA